MSRVDHFTSVEFKRFKGLEQFTLDLRRFNILVGANNAGKSTILTAFRILAAALRRAENRKSEMVHGPEGLIEGYKIDLKSISVAEENLFYNYNDSEGASVSFRLSSGNTLSLYFPEHAVCVLIPDAQGKRCGSPVAFKSHFCCSIGFVPILGPVDHREPLFEKDAARLALFSYGAARNFRNIWWHYPDRFDEFRSLVQATWPGMDVTFPELDTSHDKPLLHMWCPENRKPREIFWSGFGFQVWCQMLTHIIQSKDVSLFLIDEPDIYLHSDLQRRLIGILRELGPDILIASHSTEIITEAEADDIVLVDKKKRRATRIKSSTQIPRVFEILGSSMNPVLTQLAKTRKVIFVEGLDFQIFSRFARKLGKNKIANRSDFAVISVEGFNPDRVRTLKQGIEQTLGSSILTAAILDRDYRSEKECRDIEASCTSHCGLVVIHESKEIENFLLVPEALDRAASVRLADRARRGGIVSTFNPISKLILDEFAENKRTYVTGQYVASRRRYERSCGSSEHDEVIIQQELDSFNARWIVPGKKLSMIPGKEALSVLNASLQNTLSINVTPTSIIEAMLVGEVPDELALLISKLEQFIDQPSSQ